MSGQTVVPPILAWPVYLVSLAWGGLVKLVTGGRSGD